MRTKLVHSSAPFLMVLLSSCVSNQSPMSEPKGGINQQYMDQSVRPQDDFYSYANGGWLKDDDIIPADKGSYGAFGELRYRNNLRIKSLIDSTNKKGSANDQKIQAFFQSFLDTNRIDGQGLAPLQAEFNFISNIKTHQDVYRAFGHFANLQIDSPWNYMVFNDLKDSKVNTLYFSEGGLGLPDRDDYLKKDEKSVATQKAYRAYIQKIFDISKAQKAQTIAQDIYSLEKKLAKIHWTKVENRNLKKLYNKFKPSTLGGLNSKMPWNSYLKTISIPGPKSLVVLQPSYFKGLSTVVTTTPVAQWQSYFRFKVLDSSAIALPEAYRSAHFEFRGKVLQGVKKDKERWEKAVRILSGSAGELMGEAYVKRYFPEKAKKKMMTLVNNLLRAYKIRIEQSSWMTPQTKKRALDKLAKFRVKIGYPDKWENYDKLTFAANDLIGNLRNLSKFHREKDREKVGKPVDRDKWNMAPQIVNAYFSPVNNEIVFPAGILQPPFFSLSADDAANYGAIGSVIGHEIGHGFDDQGRRFDGHGNMVDWWAPSDEKEFKKRAQKLIDQYNDYYPLKDKPINGALTIGENIGDLAGVSIAHFAYQLSLNGKPDQMINGLTGDQRFFISFAQCFRNKYRDATLRKRLDTDPHSPPRYRVIGVLSNLDEFYKTFEVAKGDKMYKPANERVRIW